MDIFNDDVAEIESFVRAHSQFLDERIKISVNSGLTLESITRNLNQGGRKSIYNLYLSDGNIIVLKLYSNKDVKKRVKNEVEGIKYASTLGIPTPGLIDYVMLTDNPLQNAFLLMGYVDSIPFETVFQGDYEFKRRGFSFKVNYEALREHIQDATDSCFNLHQISAPRNPMYTPKRMSYLFRKYQKWIREAIESSSQEALIAGLGDLFRYYENHKDSFLKSQEYHLHGDLDPTNIIHTKKGIVLVDWEHYHKGDCAEDIAYFAERNMLIAKDAEEQIGRICENYSRKDSTFGTRLGFHIPLSKLSHVVLRGIPKEEFLEAGQLYLI